MCGAVSPTFRGSRVRATLATQEELAGRRRKLAWFSRHKRGLYFEVGGLLYGSHTSYHEDGNVFRTSPATGARPRFQGTYVGLKDFRGWHQFGIVMIQKDRLAANPPVKGRDRKEGNVFAEVSIQPFPAETLNMVVELLHGERREWLSRPAVQPPEGATLKVLELGELLVVLTLLGDDSNLLVRPIPNGFSVSHKNSRYSANAPGVRYTWEAYGGD